MKTIFRGLVVASVVLVCMTGFAQAGDRITAQEALAEMKKDVGFVPNLMEEMTVSPITALIYTRTDKMMHENAYLTGKEQQVVQLVVSLFNGCDYCSSAHSKLAEMNGVTHEDVVAIRKGEYPKDKHVGDLMWVTQTILEKRGHLTDKDLQIAGEMGFDRARLYEILVHMGRKMIANYAVHITKPEIDEEFVFVE